MLSDELRERRRLLVHHARALASEISRVAAICQTGALPGELRVLLETSAERVARASSRLEEAHYKIGVFGLIRMGKSTLLNALAGRYLSRIDALPTTAAMVQLYSGSGPALVSFLDGREPLAIPAEADAVAEFTTQEKNPRNEKGVRAVAVPLPDAGLPEDVVLIDTPGLGDVLRVFSAHAELSLQSEAHAVILVARYGAVFHQENVEFLRLALERVPRVFFVVNCDARATNLSAQGLVPSEWGTAAESALRSRFERDVAGRDRLFAHAAEEGRLQVFFVDVLAAAGARLQQTSGAGDVVACTAELERSGYARFDAALQHFIADDQRWPRELDQRERELRAATLAVGERLRELRPALEERREKSRLEIALLEAELARLPERLADVRARVEEASRAQVLGLTEVFSPWVRELVDEHLRRELEAWLDTSDPIERLEARIQAASAERLKELGARLEERRASALLRLREQVRLLIEAQMRRTLERDPELELRLGAVAGPDEFVGAALQPVMAAVDRSLGGLGTVVAAVLGAVLCGGGGAALIAAGPLGLIAGAVIGLAVSFAARLGYDHTVRESVEEWVRRASIPALLKRQVLLREGQRTEILRRVREELDSRVRRELGAAEAGLHEHLAPAVEQALAELERRSRAELEELLADARARRAHLEAALEGIERFAGFAALDPGI
ncbi:MAG: dynamin family protein [Planctomycetes bacterium]|nr:dynamin family protein [Planctomycetota bacterium]